MLTIYYRAVCEEKGAVGYVAVTKDHVQGFVCGVWDARQLRRVLLRRFGTSLAFWGFIQVVLKPTLFIEFLSRFQNSHTEEANSGKAISYELRPIIVVPNARGSGLASDLVRVLLRDAADRGFISIHLFTESANIAADKFYQKFGFQHTQNIVRHGKVYKRYEQCTENYSS